MDSAAEKLFLEEGCRRSIKKKEKPNSVMAFSSGHSLADLNSLL